MTEELKKTYDEKNIRNVAAQMGILVNYFPMGQQQGSCKGFYIQKFDVKLIGINNELTLIEQYFILAHEFGHAAQNDQDIANFVDSAVLDSTNKMEITANYFSADWILDDGDVMELALSGMTFFDIASTLNVLPGLLAYKYHSMSVRGYKGLESPVDVRSQYLNEYQPLKKMAEDYDGD